MHEVVTPEGRLVLTEGALAAVVAAAALRCAGVVLTPPRRLQRELKGLLLGDGIDPQDLGVGVELAADGERLVVTVEVIAAFGVHLPSLATEIGRAVVQDLQASAGIRPVRVQVRIQGVQRVP